MPKLALTQAERTELASILAEEIEAAKLRSLVEDWFGVRFDLIAPGASAASAPEMLLSWVHNSDRTEQLITHLLRDAPKTPKLGIFLARLGQVDGTSPVQALLNLQGPMADWSVFSARMLQRGHQICRVEIDAKPKGTGVLIAPDQVLTSYHVIKDCLDPAAVTPTALPGAGAKIRCRFDYVTLTNGTELAPGFAVELASDWLGPASPEHPHDGKVLDLPDPPDCLGLLDYAVLKLAKPVGRTPIVSGGGAERGWVEFPKKTPVDIQLEPNQTLIIGQHPAGHALHIAFGPFKAMGTRNARLRYEVNTLPGSSGAPCFDLRFDLVAIHHAEVQAHKLNQGVPIGLIRDHIAAKGGLAPQASSGFVPLWQLSSGDPVLGRVELQQLAWAMRKASSPNRILVVKGERGSGRTFSIRILKGMFAGRSDVVVDYDMGAIQDKEPDSFLRDLARDLKLPVESAPARPTDRQSARWASTVLFDWFTAAFAERYPARVEAAFSIWIALDNFDRRSFMNEETFDILVRLLQGAPQLEPLRWLLIGRAPDPAKVPASLVREDTILEPGAEAVAEYLARYVEQNKKQTTRAMIDAMAPSVVAMAQASRHQEEPLLRTLARGTAAFAQGLS